MGQYQKKITLEIAWIIFTILLAILVLLPIKLHSTTFPFLHYNIVFIFISITLTRYIFNLRNALFSHHKWTKGILFFVCIPLIMYVVDGLFEFQKYLDEVGIQELIKESSLPKLSQWSDYIKTEFVLMGVWSFIVLVLFPIRLVISVWRQINLNKV